MMFRERLMSVLDSQPILVGPGLGEEPQVASREREIREKYGVGSAPPEPPDLNEISAAVRRSLGQSGAPLSRRQLKYAPLCIWGSDSPIAEDRPLLQALLTEIARASRRAVIRGLAAVYFRMYAHDRACIDLVGQSLATMVSQDLTVLYELNRDFSVFDPGQADKRLADACIRQATTPQAFLSRFGISGPALNTGIGAAVYAAGMKRFQDELRRKPSLKTVEVATAWTDEPAEAHYPMAKKVLAETLLLPFADSAPEEALKTAITRVLLDRIGDPRIQSQNWVQMPEAERIARQWLAGLALRQFLEIVDDTAYRQQWEYRRAFWLAFYDKGAIQEAWVAFGPQGAERARRVFGRDASFGRLESEGKYVEAGHAVLLMKIGDFTVIDWSHNGRCIIWPTSNRDSPRLYRERYRSGDLAPYLPPSGGFEQAHHGAQTYRWQRNVARFLREKAEISISDRDFKVGKS